MRRNTIAIMPPPTFCTTDVQLRKLDMHLQRLLNDSLPQISVKCYHYLLESGPTASDGRRRKRSYTVPLMSSRLSSRLSARMDSVPLLCSTTQDLMADHPQLLDEIYTTFRVTPNFAVLVRSILDGLCTCQRFPPCSQIIITYHDMHLCKLFLAQDISGYTLMIRVTDAPLATRKKKWCCLL